VIAGVRSWGGYPAVEHAAVLPLTWRHENLPAAVRPLLAAGLSRSYGDSALNEGGTLLATTGLDRIIRFDRATGRLQCEAGASLASLYALVIPAGWFLPVAPGTANVTVGGAIANDVHGKNHHVAGTFAHHVVRFELLRSDGSRRECSPTREPDLFVATIGGLGLTGVITWAELQLRPIAATDIEVDTLAMPGLDAFFELAAGADATHEYTVAWIDALAQGPALGRGVFMRARHAEGPRTLRAARRQRLAVPLMPPVCAVSRPAVLTFNALYRLRGTRTWKRSVQPYEAFLFPLDGIGNWNRLYGPAGFLQHQCVVPREAAPRALREMLAAIAKAGQASPLTVLKAFGDLPSLGLLSFPRPGVTLALDFALRGPETFALLEHLDRIVVDAGGAIYPAKDARMSPATFRAGFPRWTALEQWRDPAFSSSFWRRVTQAP